jgi:hypothetical protein
MSDARNYSEGWLVAGDLLAGDSIHQRNSSKYASRTTKRGDLGFVLARIGFGLWLAIVRSPVMNIN